MRTREEVGVTEVSGNPRYEDLEDKGFLVIRGFLDPDETRLLLDDFHDQEQAANFNCAVVQISAAAVARIRDKLIAVMSEVRRSTSINVAYEGFHLGYYFASELVSLKLHQDHESFYAVQNHHDYLNFFIPVQKPMADKGNLRIIPWDALQAKIPQLHSKLLNGGGTSYEVDAGETLVTSDEGVVAEVPFDLHQLCVTPDLVAGDLLLLRGDVIHGTQDNDTSRVALSIRFTNPETLVSRRELLTGGARKTRMMQSNWALFGQLLEVFRESGLAHLPWKNLREALERREGIGRGSSSRRSAIRSVLLFQRMRTGAVLPSLIRRVSYLRAAIRIRRLGRGAH